MFHTYIWLFDFFLLVTIILAHNTLNGRLQYFSSKNTYLVTKTIWIEALLCNTVNKVVIFESKWFRKLCHLLKYPLKLEGMYDRNFQYHQIFNTNLFCVNWVLTYIKNNIGLHLLLQGFHGGIFDLQNGTKINVAKMWSNFWNNGIFSLSAYWWIGMNMSVRKWDSLLMKWEWA